MNFESSVELIDFLLDEMVHVGNGLT